MSTQVVLRRIARMLEVVPLGGLGEFGMNMLALSWGETTIVVDAGVMFPEPELLGVDLIIPDLTYLQPKGRAAALVLTHGHEDHIGAVPHVLPLRRRPGLRHAADAGAGRAEARGARPRRRRDADRGQAARARHGRPVHDRVHPRHAQHARLRGARDSHAGRRHRPHRRLQDRPDADRRRALRPAPLRRARRRRACWRCSPTAPTSIAAASPARSATSSTPSRRSSPAPTGKLIVATFSSSIYRMQILVDLAAQFDRKVAFVGRGMIENSEIAQRLGYLRIPAGVQIRDSRRRELSRRRTCSASRTGSQGEPLAALSRIAIDDHRHVKLGAGRHGRVLGARDSRQREGDRPRDEPPRPARRRRRSTRASSTSTSPATAARRS